MSNIDKDVIAEMHEQEMQIERGIKDEKQMRRVELNFFAELLSVVKGLGKSVDELNTAITTAYADKLTAYMEEFATNYKKEEKKVAKKRK